MSLRALRKRDNIPSTANNSSKTTLYKKANNTTPSITLTTPSPSPRQSLVKSLSTISSSSTQKLIRQRKLLGRATHSNPDLTQFQLQRGNFRADNLLRSKSQGDVSTVALAGKTIRTLTAANAKSEVCLQSISSHSYEPTTTTTTIRNNNNKMLSGARSHRDLSGDHHLDSEDGSTPRRMSECSMGYSQASGPGAYSRRRSSSMFASQMSLGGGAAPVDPNAPLRVPIIGYEVMEERARFTVYKLRVENPDTNDCWLVMRRYTDFVRLNGKLKQAFPHLNLMLPRKKLFGDNFNAVFLDNRVQGLQMFVNSIMMKEPLRKSKLVREFFCLDEPPSYSESMEECRAIFEAQEETIAHLKLQIQSKNDLILGLQQKLREEMIEKEQLREDLKNINLNCSHCSSANDSTSLK
ncbi:uncharacterized protein LOC133840556 [Drosophila sulfurigaster albostrigata]|uniref:uncharacterized protein LOC133840556 n=1 Tax=Drosophila sulfurigaster albostrigata TaxID=89887 RepID=UPI002D2186DC|nr:uncharacterized protein LOC133840556 [Drosophila sulfurigaster albostrigata]